MKLNKKLLIISGLILMFLLFKNMEGFVSWTPLSGFNNQWGDNDKANVGKDFKPTKTSGLIAGCDSKRDTCITY